jgi:hypothetical protein
MRQDEARIFIVLAIPYKVRPTLVRAKRSNQNVIVSGAIAVLDLADLPRQIGHFGGHAALDRTVGNTP